MLPPPITKHELETMDCLTAPGDVVLGRPEMPEARKSGKRSMDQEMLRLVRQGSREEYSGRMLKTRAGGRMSGAVVSAMMVMRLPEGDPTGAALGAWTHLL